jgi:signal transduction histidine kinase
MKVLKIMVAIVVVMALGISSPAFAAGTCTKEDVYKAVEHATKLLATKGKAALPELEKFRFCGEEGYVWVSDMDGVFILHPISKKLVNANQTMLKDPYGKYLIAEMIAKVKKDGAGWVAYSWLNPATKAIEIKCTYAKGTTMDGKKVWVAAGIYGISEALCK